MCPGVKTGDWSDLEIFYFSHFTWCPNQALMDNYHCIYVNKLLNNALSEHDTLDYAMYKMYEDCSPTDFIEKVKHWNPSVCFKLLFIPELTKIFISRTISRNKNYNFYLKINGEFNEIEIISELGAVNPISVINFYKDSVKIEYDGLIKIQQQELLFITLMIGGYTYYWYNIGCNKVPKYCWGKSGYGKLAYLKHWITTKNRTITGVKDIFKYLDWWVENPENTSYEQAILNYFYKYDNKDSTSASAEDVFYNSIQPEELVWVDSSLPDAEIDYRLSPNKFSVHVMQITDSSKHTRDEVMTISTVTLAVPIIQIARIIGDTEMLGKLFVNHIAGINDQIMQFQYANFEKLFVNGQQIVSNTCNTECNMDFKNDNLPLYLNPVINKVADEAMSEIDGVKNAPLVHVDYNNCGKVNFITVRPIIISDKSVKGNKLYTYYLPKLTDDPVRGRFALKFYINPYSFPIFTRDRTISGNSTTDTEKVTIPTAFIIKGEEKIVTNAANYYMMGSSTYCLIQRLTKDDCEDEFYVKESGRVGFFTTETYSNYINLRWNRLGAKQKTPPKKYSNYTPADELLVIDGFSFTAHTKNTGDTGNYYYKDKSYGDC